MTARLTIYKTALLLIAAPLLIQAIFFGMLIQTQAEGQSAQQWAVHTKEVIARVEEVYRRMLESYTGVRILVVSDTPDVSQPFRDGFENTLRLISELSDFVSDNKAQQERITRISDQFNVFRDWTLGEERLLKSKGRSKALEQLDEGARQLAGLRQSIDQVLAQEAELDNERMERLHQASARQMWTLVGGAIAFLATMLVLSVLFLQSVIKRLGILKDNARSYAVGKGLVPPLAGFDEIAEVDRAFHDMAASLDQQRQENEMFVYSVSHDLRSPLINLQGFSEELTRSYGQLETLLHHSEIPPAVRDDALGLMTENIEESIRYIQTAVGRLARIIDALLRLSRAGRVEYQWQTLDVAVIVGRIVDALQDTISAKRAEVVVRALPPAWGDPTAVEQILANLIGNAVNYLDAARSGTVEIGSVDPPAPGTMDGFHVYYVKDNGLGIPEAYHNRVFSAFSRLHSGVPQGEGIGLALVRRTVERHGGKIWLESEAGVGTTFFVLLPSGSPGVERSQSVDRPVTELPRGEKRTWQPSRS